MLGVHFYRMNRRTSRWLRWLWWPRPRFTHCSVQVGAYILDLSPQGFAVHEMEDYLVDSPSDSQIWLPSGSVDIERLVGWVTEWQTSKIEALRCVLWDTRLWRRRCPHSCASMCAKVVFLHLGYDTMILPGTPDELYDYLEYNQKRREYAVSRRLRPRPTSSQE